jgi:serine/threonine protein kinase
MDNTNRNRSIQTLPKTRSDNQVLSWLIHPQAEDMYSIGVMIWKVFTDTEPWRGILDTDLQGLRYVAEDDYRIQRALEGEVHGELSRQLLLKCLKTRPQDRATASEILEWITRDDVREGLVGEWKMYSSDTRASRRSKNLYGFDDTEETEEKKKPRRRGNGSGSTRGRGRPKASKISGSGT